MNALDLTREQNRLKVMFKNRHQYAMPGRYTDIIKKIKQIRAVEADLKNAALQEYQKDLINAAFKRCYGLAACVIKLPNHSLAELNRQTGLRIDFLSANLQEVKELAKQAK